MCSVGQDKTTSIGGNAPAGTMLGTSAVASSADAPRASRRAPAGTLLGGKASAPPPRDAPRDTLPRAPGSMTPYAQQEY